MEDGETSKFHLANIWASESRLGVPVKESMQVVPNQPERILFAPNNYEPSRRVATTGSDPLT